MVDNTSASLFLDRPTSFLPVTEIVHPGHSTASNGHTATLVLQKLFLAVIVFGVFGNVMTILIVRSHRSHDSSVDLFLASLAVSDFCVLLMSAFVKFIQWELGFHIRGIHNVVCKVILWIAFTTAPLSAWLLVAFTAQRAVAVLWPHRVNVLCTRRRSSFLIIAMTIILALLYSNVLYGFGLVTRPGIYTECTISSASYFQFYKNVLFYVDLVVFVSLPAVIIVASNTVLVWTVASALKNARTALATGDKGKERERKVSAITVTAIVVSTSYLVLTLPQVVFNYVYFVADDVKAEREKDRFVIKLVLFLANANFALNFYLYCLTGSKFRNEFRRLLTCRGHSSRTREASHTVSTSATPATKE